MIQVAADNKSLKSLTITIKTFLLKGLRTMKELSFPYSVPNGYNRVIIK
jgi:hypothetical protein